VFPWSTMENKSMGRGAILDAILVDDSEMAEGERFPSPRKY
jgi:hypothetical protein